MSTMEEVLYLESLEAAERLLRPARPTEVPPSATGSIQVPALGRTTGAVFDPLQVGLRLLQAAKPVAWCGCGRNYKLSEWTGLELVGFLGMNAERIELRNCGACHSTISREIRS